MATKNQSPGEVENKNQGAENNTPDPKNQNDAKNEDDGKKSWKEWVDVTGTKGAVARGAQVSLNVALDHRLTREEFDHAVIQFLGGRS